MTDIDLELHMRRVIDEAAIRDVTAKYCWAIDGLNRAGLDDVFLPDATASLGRDLVGLEQIWDRIHTVLSPLTVSQHLVGSHVVRVDGDHATSQCYFHAQHVMTGTEGGDQFIVAGIYDDRFERTAAGWRIRHRDLRVQWTSGNPKVNLR
jgi:SnoaL-like domain